MANSSAASTLDLEHGRPLQRPIHQRLLRGTLSFARRKPLGFAGLLLVLALVFVAIFATQLAPFDPQRIDLRHKLEGPSPLHRLGTDATGKDVLSRLIYGARISMLVGFGAVFIGEFGAVLIGVTSGYFGGWMDKLVQRLVEAWQALPGLIILIVILGIARRMPQVNLVFAMVVAIGLLSIPALRGCSGRRCSRSRRRLTWRRRGPWAQDTLESSFTASCPTSSHSSSSARPPRLEA